VEEDEEFDPMEIKTTSLELIRMTEAQATETQEAWDLFLDGFDTAEAAGEAMHDAMVEAVPAMTMFKLPRAVAAMRLQEGVHQIINSLNEPQDAKNLVDIIGFKHLDLEVTIPRVEAVRGALLELIANELGLNWSQGEELGF